MNRVEKELKKMQQMDDIIKEVKNLVEKIQSMEQKLEALIEKQSGQNIKKTSK